MEADTIMFTFFKIIGYLANTHVNNGILFYLYTDMCLVPSVRSLERLWWEVWCSKRQSRQGRCNLNTCECNRSIVMSVETYSSLEGSKYLMPAETTLVCSIIELVNLHLNL